MIIRVNGKEHITKAVTISQLLGELDIMSERVAVEVNLRIIKKINFDNYRLNEGDVVEIVNFVGGG
jgi:sulfur carrier protein